MTPEERTNSGLQAVFKSIYPIKDFSGKAELDFLHYELGDPAYDVEECKYRGLSYTIPLKAAFRLVIWEVDETTGAKSIKDIKEQLVYLGDLPDMTVNGTFVINGIERVICFSNASLTWSVFLIMIMVKTLPLERFYIQLVLSLIVVRGLTLNLMQRTQCLCALTESAKFQ